MKQAMAQAQTNNPGQAQRAGTQAAQKLEEAAQAARQASGSAPKTALQDLAKAAAAVQEGRQQAAEAQKQLNQSQPQAAQAAMQQAAQAMHEAAQQARSSQRSDEAGTPDEQSRFSGLKGVAAAGVPDARLLGPEGKKYAGRPWGELPGELRTRVLQDIRARYGDDYARIIQRYFEQIADTRKQ
jgi:hypothetical protein